MKSTTFAFLSLLFVAPFSGHAAERLIPAGSLIQCTVSEPKLSSKSTAVGDPVLCQAGYSVRFGSSMLPYNSFLIGHFEDYKDPGHLVGKGWMELTFDRMLIEPDTVVPIHTKVVDVPGYDVDREGRILGKGHAVRDTVAWTIPILWPIDLLNLPRRGPRPTLHAETRLTLKVMDDLGVPVTEPPQQDPSGLLRRTPSSYTPPADAPQQAPARIAPQYVEQQPAQGNWYGQPRLAPASNAPRQYRMPYVGPSALQSRDENLDPVTLVFNDGRPPALVYNYMLTPTTLYVLDGYRYAVPLEQLDVVATDRVNRMAGVDFHLLPGSAPVASR